MLMLNNDNAEMSSIVLVLGGLKPPCVLHKVIFLSPRNLEIKVSYCLQWYTSTYIFAAASLNPYKLCFVSKKSKF